MSRTTAPAAPTARDGWLFTPTASWGSCIGMLAIGLLLAVYGPAVVSLKDQFDLSDSSVGLALTGQSVGAVVGTLVLQRVLLRYGGRAAICLSYALVAAGSLAVAIAPNWTVTVAGAVVTGTGLGGADSVTSQLFAIGHGAHGGRRLTVAHAYLGIGTVLAPVAVALTGNGNHRIVFVVVSALSLVPIFLVRGVPGRIVQSTIASGRPSRRSRVVLVLAVFTLLYITHFAVQSGIGGWELRRLLDLGFDPAAASWATSGFWLAMVVGRFAVAPLADRVPLSTLVTGSCVGLVFSLALAFMPVATVWAYVAAGFFIAPIFPCGLSWLHQTGLAAGSAFAYVIAGAMAGAAIAPLLLGWFIQGSGTEVLAPALLVAALLVLASSIAARRTLRAVPSETRGQPRRRCVPHTDGLSGPS